MKPFNSIPGFLFYIVAMTALGVFVGLYNMGDWVCETERWRFRFAFRLLRQLRPVARIENQRQAYGFALTRRRDMIREIGEEWYMLRENALQSYFFRGDKVAFKLFADHLGKPAPAPVRRPVVAANPPARDAVAELIHAFSEVVNWPG